MRRALVSFFFVASLIISGFFTTQTVYATTAQCENEAGFCALPGLCNGEAPYYKINFGIPCDTVTNKCCVPSNIQTACESTSSFGLGTCSNTASSGQVSMQDLYGTRSQVSCSPYPTKQCYSYCSYDLKLQNPGSTVNPGPIVCVPSCSKTSTGAKTPLGQLLWSVNTSYCGGSPTVYGSVFVDYNHNGVKDTGEPGYSGASLTMKQVPTYTSGTTTFTGQSNSSGNYYFGTLVLGTDTVTLTVPSGYKATTATSGSRTITTSNFTNQYFLVSPAFGITPLYSISGNVFNDLNKDRIKDVVSENDSSIEPNITSGINITTDAPAGSVISVNSATGTYSITNLLEGQYTVYYTTSPLPTGYFMIYPLNGPPPQFKIYVGHNCGLNANLSFGATCTNGNLQNANFAISNSNPWFQTYGLNMRLDEGFEDKIPASPDYPRYASVQDNAYNITTPTPSLTPTVTPTPTVTLTPTPTTPPPPQNWGGCNAAGHPGVCYDRNTTPCATYYDAGNYCPGGNSVQCCVNSQVTCKSTGQCHNRYASDGGNIYNCTKTWYS